MIFIKKYAIEMFFFEKGKSIAVLIVFTAESKSWELNEFVQLLLLTCYLSSIWSQMSWCCFSSESYQDVKAPKSVLRSLPGFFHLAGDKEKNGKNAERERERETSFRRFLFARNQFVEHSRLILRASQVLGNWPPKFSAAKYTCKKKFANSFMSTRDMYKEVKLRLT